VGGGGGGSTSSSSSRPAAAGRVLRPLIVARQLDLPDGPSGSETPTALPMPRTQLARELEKYSRPGVNVAPTTAATAADTPVYIPLQSRRPLLLIANLHRPT